MAEAKKKLKKKITIRERHRTFVRKIIDEARESLTSGESIDLKKLKFLKSTLEDKSSELKSLKEAVLEYILDDSQIQEDVGASCDFTSAIQECIVDLETALTSERDHERSFIFSQSAESGLNTMQAGSSANASIHSHAKLPKLELRKFFGNPIDWYPFWESFDSAAHRNSTLTGADKFWDLPPVLSPDCL